MDQISINGLRTLTIVGALPHERLAPQPLQVDLVIDTDLAAAGRSDALEDTVDYGRVAERVVAVVTDASDVLLERLVARIAEAVLSFDGVEAIEVTLTKLRPPVPVDVATTAVRIRRER